MITKTILWKTIRELLREDMRSKNLTKKVMEKIMGQVSGLMPDILNKALPDMTGGSIPIKPKVPGIPKL